MYFSLEKLGSQTLRGLAKKLLVYKPPSVNEEAAIKDDPSSHRVKLCRERRAAVLVCLFEGDEGEVRVILTKRSMKLSSHPGNVTTELFQN